ncbi:hypothetical protein [Sulfoacidibacillus thermotolerans]|uniref:Uncharacterized protein n=1 Tax=Sulfoacidibacillus thermotolerans TaxID=1765684 RepID=A0A2U3D6S1_SULT2|nr:hypothetical protein [Sulfoacidibacillus thermotolerans]PWI56979.1 hypothetical protein BM613_10875 [Sulfoacidibacillus thermotolerans]
MFRTARTFKPHITLQPLINKGLRVGTFLTVLYIVGVAIGLVIYFSFPASLQSSFLVQIHTAISSLSPSTSPVHGAFTETTLEFILLFVIWIFAQTPIGTPFIVSLLFLRAVSTGLTFLALVAAFGWRGLYFDLLAIAPSNILTGGGFIFAATVSVLLIRHRHSGGKSSLRYSVWVAYHSAVLLAAGLLFCSGKLETAATTHAFAWLHFSQGR